MASQVDAAAQSSPTTQSQVNTTRRLSRRRHEAKTRKYDGNDIATRDAENDFAEFEVERRKRLELRVNRLDDERAAAWAGKQPVIVEDDVGPQDAPICGFDLGPLLSWLNCVPNEPPPVKKDYDPARRHGRRTVKARTQPRAPKKDVVVGGGRRRSRQPRGARLDLRGRAGPGQ